MTDFSRLQLLVDKLDSEVKKIEEGSTDMVRFNFLYAQLVHLADSIDLDVVNKQLSN